MSGYKLKCCVWNCPSFRPKKKRRNQRELSFHEIPCNPATRNQWIEFVAAQRPGWLPADHSVICELHFVASDFHPGHKFNTLKPNTIPSVLAPGEGHEEVEAEEEEEEEDDDNGDDSEEKRLNPKKCRLAATSKEPTPGRSSWTPKVERPRTKVCGTQTMPPQPTQAEEDSAELVQKRLTKAKSRLLVERRLVSRLKMQVRRMEASCEKLQDQLDVYDRFSEAHARLERMKDDARQGSILARFLSEQYNNYVRTVPVFSDTVMRYCVYLFAKSPLAYEYMRSIRLVNLPSKARMQRFVAQKPYMFESINTTFLKNVLLKPAKVPRFQESDADESPTEIEQFLDEEMPCFFET